MEGTFLEGLVKRSTVPKNLKMQSMILTIHLENSVKTRKSLLPQARHASKSCSLQGCTECKDRACKNECLNGTCKFLNVAPPPVRICPFIQHAGFMTLFPCTRIQLALRLAAMMTLLHNSSSLSPMSFPVESRSKIEIGNIKMTDTGNTIQHELFTYPFPSRHLAV